MRFKEIKLKETTECNKNLSCLPLFCVNGRKIYIFIFFKSVPSVR